MSRAAMVGAAALSLVGVAMAGMPWGMTGHMAGHMMLVAVAAPVLAAGLGSWPQRMAGPLAMSVVELVVVWGWHLPAMRRLADGSVVALAAEQASFLAAGVLLWGAALARPAAGVGALLLTSMHMTLLGALIGLAPRPLWSHGHGGPLDPLADQQMGGVVMLVMGGAAYLSGGLTLLGGILRQREVAA